MKAIQLQAFGNPADVVRLVDVPDVGAPNADEMIIEVEASPVNGTDFLIMAGRYGKLPKPPAILGYEGVGRVAAIGRDVKHVKEGDRVLIPVGQPAWTERVKTNASWLRPLPDGDVNQLSMIGINPASAYLLLTDFIQLKRGDWIIQNGANSSVGRAVIAIAKTMGVKTVNVVRRAELVDELKPLGGDLVLVDGPDLAKTVAAQTGNAPISLGLDMVAGESTANLMGALAPQATLVLYSIASQKPAMASGPHIIFGYQSIRGFWLVNWFKTALPETVTQVYGHVAPLVASGAISAPVAETFAFEQFGQALSAASKREGKVILKPR